MSGIRAELDETYPGAWAVGLFALGAGTKRPVAEGWLADAMARYETWRTGSGSVREALRAEHLAAVAAHVSRGGNVGLALPRGAAVIDAEDPATIRACDALDGAWQWSRESEQRAHAVVRCDPALRQRDLRIDGAPAPVKTRIGGRGYIVAAPSTHPETGEPYTWARALPDSLDALPELPAAWAEQLRGGAEREETTSTDAGEGEIPRGARNETLTSLAGAMRRRGAEPDEILAALTVANRRCVPPLPEEELYAIAHSVGRYAPAGEPLTDTGNAERLVRLHGRDLRYVHTWARWLAWDGRRFAPDTSGEIHRRAKETVRAAYAESAQLSDADARKELARWATKSESAARIDAMIGLARAEVPVAHEALDADPWVLNVPNGTLDLRTGELRPHRRSDLLTKLAPVEYDPSAEAPTWERFLERILPDAAVRAFVRRATGYSLTADTGEQVLFLLWGSGANGKSTFLETLMAALGDYAMKTPAETLLARREGAIPNDVAALRGARLVAAVETEEGRRLAEARLKELTGGDTVSARFMRAEWFTFKPVAKLWVATNHRPRVKGTDEAIWRRIRLIPFTVTVPEPERDPKLPERLRAELPGILAWAVAGCLDWQRDGLRPPDAVLAATSDYRAEQDVLGAFLEDRCVLAPECWVASAQLFGAYKRWCEETGEHAMTQRVLGLALGERGFTDARKGSGRARRRGWHGIGLRHEGEEVDA